MKYEYSKLRLRSSTVSRSFRLFLKCNRNCYSLFVQTFPIKTKRRRESEKMEVSEMLSRLQKIIKPDPHQRIYKDECVFSFDTPESETGLYLCLKTFLGIGRDYLDLFHQKTGNSVYLHIKRTKKEIPVEPLGDGPEKKVTRLAIGIEGGFDPDAGKAKYEYDDSYSIIFLPEFSSLPWPNPDIPKPVADIIQMVVDSDSAAKLAELQSLTETWDGEMRAVSKHAENLLQLDNGVQIPPTGWKCEKCDLTNNLWLNLTDGKILCGRKFYDGSGGNDHAVHHYRDTGYPLAVKLGTITKEGKADVYSYEEDDMVEDPHLVKHLAHFGINIAQLEKSDKSMAELELDLNQKFGEWVAMQETNHKLTPLYGPGYTGLVNLGNSCYLNSVMQVIFSIPDFKRRFVENGPEIIKDFPSEPAMDFNIQMAKLGLGLWSGKYSKPEGSKDDTQPGIKPQMFKTLMGRGHPDFSSKRQQDAQEFFLHFINVLERNSRHRVNPADCFKFKVEDKFQCSKSNKVKYTHRTEYSLPLPIPLEAAINKEEVAAYEEAQKSEKEQGLTAANRGEPRPVVRPRIKLESCLDCFVRSETVDFYSTAVNQNTSATKTTRLATFPDYLLLHLKKFTLRQNWVSVKLDVAVEMPDEIDLASLKAMGPQPGEEQLPEMQGSPPPVTLDENIIQQLVVMGFHIEACKKAVFYTQNTGSLEAAVQWLMDHFGDLDFEKTFVLPGTDRSAGSTSSMEVDEEGIQTIVGMGFTRAQAVKALRATGNSVERAADWIFSHLEELDAVEEESADKQGGSKEPTPNKEGSRYRLLAFISHMGTSTMVGHYVCHILRDGHWVIFNDNKVALSENPPKELGYLYLYEKI